MTFPVDVKQNINEVEKKIKSSISQKGKLSMDDVIEIKKDFRGIVQFHGDTNQLSRTNFFLFFNPP